MFHGLFIFQVNQAKVNDHLYLSKLDDVSYIYEVDESMEMPIRLMLIYKIVDFPVLGQAITLVGAWRKVDSQYEPWQVFWNYIMPLDGCVVSDNIQTPTGREFFIKQCIDSFKRGGYAYVLDGDNLIELKPESIKCEVSRYYHGSSKGLSSRLVVWLPIN